MAGRSRVLALVVLGALVAVVVGLLLRRLREPAGDGPLAAGGAAGAEPARSTDLRGSRSRLDRGAAESVGDDAGASRPERATDRTESRRTVVVTDEDDRPIAEALVTDDWSDKTVSTDGVGRAALVLHGDVSVRAEGFLRLAVSCEPGDEIVHVRLARDRRAELVFRLTGDGVTDADEVHLWVECEGRDGDVSQDFVFAKRGLAEFPQALEPGAYVVAATTEHLVSAPRRIDVVEGRRNEVTVLMSPVRAIQGVVRDPRGAPLVGAHVAWEAKPMGYGWQGLSGTTTDAAGRFRIADAPEGAIDVVAELDGYAAGRRSAGGGAGEIEVTLRKTGSIEGRVDGRDGGGLEGIRISAASLDGASAPSEPGHPDGGGAFRMSLAEGLWRLRAENDFAAGASVDVRVGPDAPTSCTLEPPPKGMVIVGRVVEASTEGEVAADAWLRFSPESPDAAFANMPTSGALVRTDREGQFRMSRLPRGTYTVTATGLGGLACREGVGPVDSDVTLRLEPMAAISLRLRDPTRPYLPVPTPRRAIIYLASSGSVATSSEVGDEGGLFENLPVGAYTLTAVVGKAVVETSLTVSGDERTWARRTLALVPGATIAGTVRDARGTPIPGAAVEVRRERLPWDARDRCDGEGRFAVEGLPPGRWRLQVLDADLRPTHEAIVTVEPGRTYEVVVGPRAP